MSAMIPQVMSAQPGDPQELASDSCADHVPEMEAEAEDWQDASSLQASPAAGLAAKEPPPAVTISVQAGAPEQQALAPGAVIVQLQALGESQLQDLSASRQPATDCLSSTGSLTPEPSQAQQHDVPQLCEDQQLQALPAAIDSPQLLSPEDSGQDMLHCAAAGSALDTQVSQPAVQPPVSSSEHTVHIEAMLAEPERNELGMLMGLLADQVEAACDSLLTESGECAPSMSHLWSPGLVLLLKACLPSTYAKVQVYHGWQAHA